VLSPFRSQNVPVEPGKRLLALQEHQKKEKDESRHRPRISLYRWLGQHNEEDERRVTFKMSEKQDKDSNKDIKEGLDTIIRGLLDPKVSLDETKEYERYGIIGAKANVDILLIHGR
jgi:hypothetical protein